MAGLDAVTLGPGDVAPDFEFTRSPDASGSLHGLRGSPAVLVFHASRRTPARDEYVATYNRMIRHASVPVRTRLLSIGDSGPWNTLEFEDAGVSIPFVTNTDAGIARRYGVSKEAVFVVDALGVICWRYDGTEGALPSLDDLAESLHVVTGIPIEPGAEWWSRRRFIAMAAGAAVAMGLGPRGGPTTAAHATPRDPILARRVT